MSFARSALALAIATTAASCSILEPRPDPTRFFLLTASIEHPPAPGGAPETIGVGPITLPDYLNRLELVRRKAQNEIVPSPTERWAEPLTGLTARVLGEDLAQLTGAQFVQYPWLAPVPHRQVIVDLFRFEPVEGTRVELVARVRSVRFADNTSTEHRHEISLPLASDDGTTVAETMSRALLELAREIVAKRKG